jgi:hypothetical protein
VPKGSIPDSAITFEQHERTVKNAVMTINSVLMRKEDYHAEDFDDRG